MASKIHKKGARIDALIDNMDKLEPKASSSNDGFMSAADKEKLDDLPNAEQLAGALGGKQDTIPDLSTIRSGAAAGGTAYQKPGTGIPESDMSDAVKAKLAKAESALQEHQDISGKQDVIQDLSTIRSGAAAGGTAYQKPGTGIPESDMSDAVKAKLAKAETAIQQHQDINGKQDVIQDLSTIRSGAAAGGTAYQKPGTGIPESDMSDAVKAKLAKAETALQQHQDISGKQDVIQDLAVIRSGAAAGGTAYQKPGTGIPASDLSSEVQDMIENGGKTKSVSVNGGTPVTPDANGLVDLTIEQANVTIGTVTTGAAGSNAEVHNSGTPTAPVLDFVIPKGDTGTTGPQGPQGDSAVYNPDDPDTPDFVMASTPGQSTTKAMTQKAVTDQFSLLGGRVEELESDIGMYGVVQDTSNGYNNNRYRWQYFKNLQAGDRLIIDFPEETYSVYAFTVLGSSAAGAGGNVGRWLIQEHSGIKEAVVISTDGDNGNGTDVYVSVLCRKANGDNVSRSDVSDILSKCHVKVLRAIEREQTITEDISELQNEVSEINDTLDYVTDNLGTMEVIPETEEKLAGTRYRWDYFKTLQAGDKVFLDYPTSIYRLEAITVLGATSITSTNVTVGRFVLRDGNKEGVILPTDGDNGDGTNVFLRVLCAKAGGGDISASDVPDVIEKCHVRVERYSEGGLIQRVSELEDEVEDLKKKSIRILYIGNSLTQDGVAYLPTLLKELAPDIDYKIYNWYVGGKTLAQQYQYFINNTKADIFSTNEGATAWTNSTNSTMSGVLASIEFDIVVLQEYMNYQTEIDATAFNNCVDYIRSHYGKPFKVACLLHPPLRSAAAEVYARTKAENIAILKNTDAVSVIDTGAAVMEAMKTSLDELGDQGHLSTDGTHTQEGLPCLLQTYVHALWIFRQLGLPYGVSNSQLRITTDVYNSINVPGPNIGTGVITGTDEQHTIAQLCAIKADKIGKALEIQAFSDIE